MSYAWHMAKCRSGERRAVWRSTWTSWLSSQPRRTRSSADRPRARPSTRTVRRPARRRASRGRSGVDVSDLTVEDMDGGQYVVARARVEGRRALDVLAEELPTWVDREAALPRTMRWNQTGVAFSRPDSLADGAPRGRRGALLVRRAGQRSNHRWPASRRFAADRPASAADYRPSLASYGVIVDADARQAAVLRQAQAAAQDAAGLVPDDPALLEEVANLVEVPTAILGSFEKSYLDLPSGGADRGDEEAPAVLPCPGR